MIFEFLQIKSYTFVAMGKTHVNRQMCSFFHPRRCEKFCKLGYRGCRGGCNTMLCMNSVKFKECYLENCTPLVHLSGTDRGRNLVNRFSAKQFGVNHRTQGGNNHQVHQPGNDRRLVDENFNNQNGNFVYQNSFPPLSNARDDRLEKLSSQCHQLSRSISQIEGCLEQLMKSGLPLQASRAPASIFNNQNISQAGYNNQGSWNKPVAPTLQCSHSDPKNC